ncbi:Alpha/Beta hydrolase protein [Cryomyces antarcticus]
MLRLPYERHHLPSCSTPLLCTPFGRSQSYSTVVSSPSEEVTVNCRSNGSITLNIHYPLTGGASPVLIYLPRGPLLPASRLDDDLITALRHASNTTVVRLNYRLGDGHFYPSPIHDVLTGYDWIVKHLVPSAALRSTRYGRCRGMPDPVRLGVCGELVGGSLATMLAVTECRKGETRIGAAAVNNPIVDWIFPNPTANRAALRGSNELSNSKRTKSKGPQPTSWQTHAASPSLSATDLLRARSAAFKQPAAYFDPFASPLLFFRTAGAEVPPPAASLSEFDLASLALFPDTHHPLRNVSNPNNVLTLGSVAEAPQPADEAPAKRFRKIPRRHPARGSGLRLPDMHISAGAASPLLDQAVELATRMRTSTAGWDQGGWAAESGDEQAAEDARLAAAVAEAHRRIELCVRPGAGLWCERGAGDAWRADVQEVGSWFRRALG